MAEPTDELSYLSPDFNPTSITIPKLRSILVAHNIPYPSSAKKSQLVQLFKDNITPKARNILAAQSRIKRSQKGITDVPSSQDGAIRSTGENYVNSNPPSDMKRLRRGERKSLRFGTEEPVGSATSTYSAPPKDQLSEPRRITGKHGRTSETIANDQPTFTRQRTSRNPQQDDQLDGPYEDDDTIAGESPFSTDNPFQRSSSPLAPGYIKEKRRKTDSLLESRQKQEKRAPRRKATSLLPTNHEYAVSVPFASDFRPAVSSSTWHSNRLNNDQHELEPGEEFTPEEREEMKMSRARGTITRTESKSHQSKMHSYTAMKIAPWAITLAIVVGFGAVWRQEKIHLGYCGLETQSPSLGGVHIPNWASFLQPQCEPCPQHAYCYPKLDTVCENGFIKVPHPLAFRGLVPLPPTCEPDTDAMLKVKKVADRAVESLRERNARWECGESFDKDGHTIDSPATIESELKDEISKKKKKGMSQTDFDEIWNNALGEIRGREEVTSYVDPKTGNRLLRSKSLARLSFSCAVRRSVRLTLAQYFWQFMISCVIATFILYARYSIRRDQITEKRAKYLASLALDRLAAHRDQHAQDPNAFPEGWISMGQLRDDILRTEFSASRRQKLWEKVQQKVEQNSNIRPMVRESHTGEVSRVWEWIGPYGVTSSSPSAHALPQGRSSSMLEQQRELAQLQHEGRSSTGWAESRPIY